MIITFNIIINQYSKVQNTKILKKCTQGPNNASHVVQAHYCRCRPHEPLHAQIEPINLLFSTKNQKNTKIEKKNMHLGSKQHASRRLDPISHRCRPPEPSACVDGTTVNECIVACVNMLQGKRHGGVVDCQHVVDLLVSCVSDTSTQKNAKKVYIINVEIKTVKKKIR